MRGHPSNLLPVWVGWWESSDTPFKERKSSRLKLNAETDSKDIMNIFFDVDDTIISFNGALRPHVHEVFQKLVDDGHDIYIWSGVGLRWEVIDRHNLRPYIIDCFVKPTQSYREGLKTLRIPIEPDFCVDDHPELVKELGGEAIKPYFWVDENDKELLRIYDVITEFHQNNGA